jgi:hypothetical protein
VSQEQPQERFVPVCVLPICVVSVCIVSIRVAHVTSPTVIFLDGWENGRENPENRKKRPSGSHRWSP